MAASKVVVLAAAFSHLCFANTALKSGFLSRQNGEVEPQTGGINVESLLSDSLTVGPAPTGDADKDKAKEAIMQTTSSLTDLLKGQSSASGGLGDLLATLDSNDTNVNLSMSALTMIDDILVKNIRKENNLTRAAWQAAVIDPCNMSNFTPPANVSGVMWLTDTYDYQGRDTYEECRSKENDTWVDYFVAMQKVDALNATINETCPCQETLDCSSTNGESFRDYLVRQLAWFQAQKAIVDNRTQVCNWLRGNKTEAEINASNLRATVTDANGSPKSPCCFTKLLIDGHFCDAYGKVNDDWNAKSTCYSTFNTTVGTANSTMQSEVKSQKLQMRLALRMKCLFKTFFKSSADIADETNGTLVDGAATPSAEGGQKAGIEYCIDMRYETAPEVLELDVADVTLPQLPSPLGCGLLPGGSGTTPDTNKTYSEFAYGAKDDEWVVSDTFSLPSCAANNCPQRCSEMETARSR